MKITKTKLKRIIKEEISRVLDEKTIKEASEQQALGLPFKFTSQELIDNINQQKENIDADRARGLVGQLTSKIQKEEDEDLRSQMKELKIELLKIFNPRGAAELEAKPQKKERIRQFRADYDNAIGRGISHEGAKEYARQMSLDRTVSAART